MKAAYKAVQAAVLGITVGLFLLQSSAFAAEPQIESRLLPYDTVGFDPGQEERIARGGELLVAGPDERLALYNPIEGTVVVLKDLQLSHLFEVGEVSDLAWTDDGYVAVLDAPTRTVAIYDLNGTLHSARSLPDMVPQGVRLVVEGDELFGQDVFGNLHRIADRSEATLYRPAGQSLVRREAGVRWNAESRQMEVGGAVFDLPKALKASGQRAGDRWLVVDQVVSESPIEVERHAIDLETYVSVELPVRGRVYVPNGDFVEDSAGRFHVLIPTQDGLEVRRVTP